MGQDDRRGGDDPAGPEMQASRAGPRPAGLPEGAALDDVLASIRALVSAETSARLGGEGGGEAPVLMLTPEMRIDAGGDARGARAAEARSGAAILGAGLGPREGGEAPAARAAPLLDEEALRAVVNRIVREELQGELGERISRNLRKLIRREIAHLLEQREKR